MSPINLNIILYALFSFLNYKQDKLIGSVADLISDTKEHKVLVFFKEMNSTNNEMNVYEEYEFQFSFKNKSDSSCLMLINLEHLNSNFETISFEIDASKRIDLDFFENSESLSNWYTQNEKLGLTENTLNEYCLVINFILDILNFNYEEAFIIDDYERNSILGKYEFKSYIQEKTIHLNEKFDADEISYKQSMINRIIKNSINIGIPNDDLKELMRFLDQSEYSMLIKSNSEINIEKKKIDFAKKIIEQKAIFPNAKNSITNMIIEIKGN